MDVGPPDQDIIEVCADVRINRDSVVERTEYFTVSLRRQTRQVRELAYCEVAISDGNGGMFNATCVMLNNHYVHC